MIRANGPLAKGENMTSRAARLKDQRDHAQDVTRGMAAQLRAGRNRAQVRRNVARAAGDYLEIGVLTWAEYKAFMRETRLESVLG